MAPISPPPFNKPSSETTKQRITKVTIQSRNSTLQQSTSFTPVKVARDSRHNTDSIRNYAGFQTTENWNTEYNFEAEGNVFRIPPLIDKAFRPQGTQNKRLLERIHRTLYDGREKRWINFPETASEENVTTFLELLQKAFVETMGDRVKSVILSHGKLEPRGRLNGSSKRKPDLIFLNRKSEIPPRSSKNKASEISHEKSPDESLASRSQPDIHWSHIRAFAELKQDPRAICKRGPNSKILNDIVALSHQLFGTQPTRQLVRCFSLAGSNLRCYLIDRAGVFYSDQCDIHEEPNKFLNVLHSFFCDPIGALGFDDKIYIDHNKHRIIYDPTLHPAIKSSTYILSNNTKRLYVDLQSPICFRTTLFSRATQIWRARAEGDSEYTFVVKRAWRYSSRCSEGDILASIPETETSPYCCGYIEASDMVKTCASRFNLDDCEWSSVALKITANGLATSSFSGPFSTSGTSISTPANTKTEHKQLPSRTLTQVISNKIGRPLHTYRTVGELLAAVRDALKGYGIVYQAGYLHRDVSDNNIMVATSSPHQPDSHDASGNLNTPSGFLIDFDYAIKMIDIHKATAPDRTGTPLFMSDAILAKSPEPHNRMHDLQSFFYVLIWMLGLGVSTCEEVPIPPKHYQCLGNRQNKHPLRSWTKLEADFGLLAESKDYVLAISNFSALLDKLPQENRDPLLKDVENKKFQVVKACAAKLRHRIFRIENKIAPSAISAYLPSHEKVLHSTQDITEEEADSVWQDMVAFLDEAVIALAQG